MKDDSVQALMIKIRQRREELNYSQDYVAYKLNLTQKGYSKLELGKTKLRLDEFLLLCEILEVSAESLLSKND